MSNPAIHWCERLRDEWDGLGKDAKPGQVVAVDLVLFGGIIVQVESIGAMGPDMLTVTGINVEGQRVSVLQHIANIQVVMKVLTDSKRAPVGFAPTNDESP